MNPTNFVYWLSGILSTAVGYNGINISDTKKILSAIKEVKTENGSFIVEVLERNEEN